MEDIVENFAKKLGIEPSIAREGISITSRHFILKSDPVKAGGLLSMLPPSLTNLFSIEEKNEIQMNQKFISPEKVIEKISDECLRVINKKEKNYMKKQ
ncbi:MAG TPA: hypothetical protein VFM31_04500 [Nitrososphaeraceae archaeon]|jgi:hypothetical protein|nr:hypothetical protein [Nitrososphaeraceae archaeon]